MLKQRIITALLLAPLVLLIDWYANTLVFSLFTSFLVLMIGFEWCHLAQRDRIKSVFIAVLLAVLTFVINFTHKVDIDVQRILIGSGVIWLMAFVWLTKPDHGKQKSLIKYTFGVGILLLFGTTLLHVHESTPQGAALTLVLFLLIWVADIGAYVAGKTFGKHKLAPRISPGKTIEGLLGALVMTAIFGVVVARWMDQQVLHFVLAFPVIAAVSVVGDLFASLLKRHANIKDSGFLLPGHGGFLDRFDSLIAATPFYCAFIHYFFQG